jgi:hypothetical protein
MSVLEIIVGVIKLFGVWLETKREKDALVKIKKEKIMEEAQEALKARDSSGLLGAFNKLNRL